MKKDKLDKVIYFFIFSIILAGCSTSMTSSKQVTEESLVTSTEEMVDYTLLKETIKKYIKDKDEYRNTFSELKDSEIKIETRIFHDETLYFLLYTPTDYWSTSLYQIREQNGELLGLDYIAEGTTEYFNFDIITISEGDYVSVYSASYMGNGNLTLINLEDIPERKIGAVPNYEFYAIDGHYEQMQFNHTPVVSSIFENSVLVPEYVDVNQDGHTDVLLKGMIEEYEYDVVTDTQSLKNKREVCQVYQFEPETETFILESGEDLREKRQLSLYDSVINNHELLNDTLCFEYKVQDILQYHGEPKKTIDYKDAEGMYRHYMVYDGMIYVILGEEAIQDMQYIDYIILTNEIYSLSIGIQVGMDEKELADTGLYFEPLKNGDDLDSQLLSGKAGYLRRMKIKYDTIYYAEGCFEENIALAVVVRDGNVIQIAIDKLY